MNPHDSLPNPSAVPTAAGSIDRRVFLGAASSALLAAVTLPAVASDPSAREGNASDPGPENAPIRVFSPNTFLPPATDHGEVQTFWSSFSAAHRRIQDGGWSRQVTVADFPISKDIAGVNMRLVPGGIRELHWHVATEWAIMLTGRARITAIDNEGRGYVKDVGKDDLWVFPSGIPHSIQGLEPDGAEFLLVFDDGSFSEGNTTLLSDWLRHTPPEVLSKNWNLPVEGLKSVYTVPPEGRYIFQTPPPGPLVDDQRAVAQPKGLTPVAFDFSLSNMPPTYQSRSGEVRVVDGRNFPVSIAIAAAHVVIKPGGLRELHWHQNADEWQYYLQGKGRMTVFFTGGKARTADFASGDVGYVPRAMAHYIENTGDTDLIMLEMFKAPRFQDLSLSEWAAHTPPELVMSHLNLDRSTVDKIPRTKTPIVPT